MDQNQTIDNDLQKAIDDITNTTNTDPVFSDPVAAPSSIPEGDTGKLSDPIGPFPSPNPSKISPNPDPISQFNSADNQDLGAIPTIPDLAQPTTPPTSEAMPMASNSFSTAEPTTSTLPNPPEPPLSTYPNPSSTTSSSPVDGLSTAQIKTAALRDLAPLMNKLPLEASQKFGLYRDIIEDLDDKTVLGPAYETARDITDETERAKALLYLVESIDKM